LHRGHLQNKRDRAELRRRGLHRRQPPSELLRTIGIELVEQRGEA
jgi:hypothetical protein